MQKSKNQLAKLPAQGGLIPTAYRLNALAQKFGLFERATRKITAEVLLGSLISAIAFSQSSCRSIALAIGITCDINISRVAVWKFISKKAIVPFIESVIGFTIKKSFQKNLHNPILKVMANTGQTLDGVGKILIGDATHIRLHSSLAGAFPGSRNQTNVKVAMLKFQLIVDLLTGRVIQCSLDPYGRSDAKAAPDIIAFLEKGDLLIRDLGFATMEAFESIIKREAYFISRLKIRVYVLDREGNRIDLVKRLRRDAARPGQSVRIPILMTETHRVECVLIAFRVPEEVANERRRKLKAKHQEQGWSTPSAEYLALQDWTLLVTNLPEKTADNQKVRNLYLMRWRIELIFKACKSHTGLLKIARHKTNEYHAKALILTWILLMILLADRGVFSMATLREVICPESHEPYQLLDIHNVSLHKTLEKLILNFGFSIELYGCGMDPLEHSKRTLFYSNIHNKTEIRKGKISLSQVLNSVLEIENSQRLS